MKIKLPDFHFFHKWGKVEDGMQYCTICNKARQVPSGKCDHKWEVKEEHSLVSVENENRKTGFFYVMQCKKCGELTKRQVELSNS